MYLSPLSGRRATMVLPFIFVPPALSPLFQCATRAVMCKTIFEFEVMLRAENVTPTTPAERAFATTWAATPRHESLRATYGLHGHAFR
jgi:hypothetical protein